MNAPFVSRAEYETVVAERDLYYERSRYLERRNRTLGRIIDSFHEGQESIAAAALRLERMASHTELEPDRDRAGHGFVSTEEES